MDPQRHRREGIIFTDLDGTLVDTMPRFFATMREVMRELGAVPPSIEALRKHTLATTTKKQSFDEAMVHYFASTEDRLRFFEEVWRRFRSYTTTSSRLFPGVQETLKQCNEEGWSVVMYTGRDEPVSSLRAELARLGIETYFDDVYSITAYNGPNGNPKGRMLHTIFRRYRTAAEAHLLVSDLPDDLIFTEGTPIRGVGVLTGVGDDAVFSELEMPMLPAFSAIPDYLRDQIEMREGSEHF